MADGRGHMERVELVEDDEPGADLGPVPAVDPQDLWTATARAWLRRHRGPVVVLVAVLLLALAGTQTVAVLGERSRAARLAAVPGLLAPVGPDLRVRWTADAETSALLFGGAQVAGTVVGMTTGPGDGIALVGLDPADGTERWRTVSDTGPQATEVSDWPTCAPARTVAACTVRFTQTDRGDRRPDRQVLWVLDPHDGRLLRTQDLPAEAALVVGGLVVTAARTEPGRRATPWTVAAHDPRTGAETWSFTTPTLTVPLTGEETDATGSSTPALLETPTGRVVLRAGGGVWLIDPQDGTVLRTAPNPQPPSYAAVGRADSVLEVRAARGETLTRDDMTSTLLLPDGRRLPVEGWPLWSEVDDGSAADVLLLVGDDPSTTSRLEARDTSTGDLLWTSPVAPVRSVLLDGRLYLVADGALLALDVTTGEELWRTEVGDDDPAAPVSDGDQLLLVGDDLTVTSYSLSDGTRRWQRDLHDEVRAAAPAGAGTSGVVPLRQLPWLVVALSDGSAVVLG